MAEYHRNFARKDCAELRDGDILTRCNVSQEKAHTRLACEDRSVTFRRCNMKNVELWPEAVVEDCSLVGIHADMVEKPRPDPVVEARIHLGWLKADLGEDALKEAAKSELSLKDETAVEIP